jgi:putative DNA primase/helicase
VSASAEPLKKSRKSKDRPPANYVAGAELPQTAARETFSAKFMVQDGQIWYRDQGRSGGEQSSVWVPLCAEIRVTGRARDPDGRGWIRLVEFLDPLNRVRRLTLADARLSNERSDWYAPLADEGFGVPVGPTKKRLLAEYLLSIKIGDFATVVRQSGWHGSEGFVFGDGGFIPRSSGGEPAILQREVGENVYSKRGTLGGWQLAVAAPCAGNSRLAFAVCVALAGPLIKLHGGFAGTGFHIYGDSGTGKTTAVHVAASVWGGTSFVTTWQVTENGIEAMAVAHNDTVLVMDEIAQVSADALGVIIYTLSQGQGKARSHQGGNNKPRHRFRIIWLSSGEIPTTEMLRRAQARGQRPFAGQETRQPDIPADAGAGMGVFETLHGRALPRELAEDLARATHENYGHAGDEFVTYILQNYERVQGELHQAVADIVEQLSPEEAASSVKRAIQRFALVAYAGELAIEAGVLPWAKGEAIAATAKCVNAWLVGRGGSGSGEDLLALRHIQDFLVAKGDSAFVDWHRAVDDHRPKLTTTVGFKKLVGPTTGKPIESGADYARESGDANGRFTESQLSETRVEYVFPMAGWRQVIGGHSDARCRRLLSEMGVLITDKGRLTSTQRLPGHGGGKAKCIVIDGAFLGMEL